MLSKVSAIKSIAVMIGANLTQTLKNGVEFFAQALLLLFIEGEGGNWSTGNEFFQNPGEFTFGFCCQYFRNRNFFLSA